MEYQEQVDLPGEIYDGYEEEQMLIRSLFAKPAPNIPAIKAVISSRKFDCKTLLNKYEEELTGFIDKDIDDLLQFMKDGAYLQDIWQQITKPGYQKWFYKYLEHRDNLVEIIHRYKIHDGQQDVCDFGYCLSEQALEAKNELYLAQTQPGEPEDLDIDQYLKEYNFNEEIKSTMNGNAKSSVNTEQFDKLKDSFRTPWNSDFVKSKPAPAVRETSPAYTAVHPITKEVYEKQYEIKQELADYKTIAQVEITFFEDPRLEIDYHDEKTLTRIRKQRKGRFLNFIEPPNWKPIDFEYVIPYKQFENGTDRGEDDPDVFLTLSEDFKDLFELDTMPDNSNDYERIPDDFDESLFDDRGVGSAAIEYAETEEFKPREYQSLRFSDIGKMIATVKKIAYKYKRHNFFLRNHFWELGYFPDSPRLRFCRDTWTVTETGEVKFVSKYELWKKYGIKKPEYLDDWMLEDILIEKIPTVLETIVDKFNQMLKDGIAKQDVVLLLLDGVFIDFLAEDIRIPDTGETLEDFIFYAGDEILDYAHAMQDAPGWKDADEDYYSYLIDKIDLLKDMPYDDSKVEYSKTFNEVVLEHIFNAASVKDAYQQAYHECKMQESPLGAYAYRLARFFGKSHSQAMREFYQVAQEVGDIAPPRDKIVSVHNDHITVLTAISGYKQEREINVKVTAIKARNSELFVPADADITLKRRLLQFLKPLNLSPKVLSTIKE